MRAKETSQMLKALTALLLTAGTLALLPAPEADAAPCLHRGRQHVVQHANGNADADSRWHELQGQQRTCDTDGGPRGTDDSWQRRQADIDRDRHGW